VSDCTGCHNTQVLFKLTEILWSDVLFIFKGVQHDTLKHLFYINLVPGELYIHRVCIKIRFICIPLLLLEYTEHITVEPD
jgi:hypothetical protein